MVAHVAVSLDGATTGFAADVAAFHELATTWREDVTLTGADTILAQEEALAAAPQPGPRPDGPLLAVVDSRARVRRWTALRDAGHWSGVLAVSSAQTPGLVDEVSLLVHPVLAGTASDRRWFGTQPPATALALQDVRQLAGDLVWLRYRPAP
ncbi:hypothetical protein [Geodermatophilus obscurus]|uniref:hypothetical protein n=1 Tax=Geodermatophilus obscurus TaxID=1861 RepID=UPI001AD8F370|nr:hypothetical protein [Geodermatophilus obscurus]